MRFTATSPPDPSRVLARASAPASGRRPIRKRAVVVTTTADDAVRYLGGWIFDRATAGYETLVLPARSGGSRALAILGAQTRSLTGTLDRPAWSSGIEVLLAAAECVDSDIRVREAIHERAQLGPEQTYLWSPDPHRAPVTGFETGIRYRVSMAGLAFKRTALEATGAALGPCLTAETLWTPPAVAAPDQRLRPTPAQQFT